MHQLRDGFYTLEHFFHNNNAITMIFYDNFWKFLRYDVGHLERHRRKFRLYTRAVI